MSDAFRFACFACRKMFTHSRSSPDVQIPQRPLSCPECNGAIYHLLRQMTVAEAEAENMICDDRLSSGPVPFGWSNKSWVELLNQMQLGDELWEYDSPQEDWDRLMGSSGFILIRDGQIIADQVCCMN